MNANVGVAIVGAGPAGSAAAIALAQSGQRPLLVERHSGQCDSLCGGFLSWTTISRLKALGVDPSALGAHPVFGARIFTRSQTSEIELPQPAAGLSRMALDAALVERARNAGAIIRRGTVVRRIGDGRLHCDGSALIAADRIILATGKHDLRGCQRPRHGGDPFIGLRWRVEVAGSLCEQLCGRIELFLFRDGYAGLVRHEGGMANLCMAVRRRRLAREGNSIDRLLADIAHECLAFAKRLQDLGKLPRPQAIANVPYGWRARTSPTFYRIGDQAAVIPSLAGEGIGIALASGTAAAAALLTGIASGPFQLSLSRSLERSFLFAGAAARLAQEPAGAEAFVRLARSCPYFAKWLGHVTRI